MKRQHLWCSYAILPTLFVLLSGCNNMLNGTPSTTEGSSAKVAGSELDFKTVSTNVLEPMCLNCHSNANGNSAGVNLETYPNVFVHLKEIRADVMDGSMPASGPSLTSEERDLIVNWIDAGAPEFSTGTPSPTNPSGPTTTTTLPSTTTTTLAPRPIPTTTTTMAPKPTPVPTTTTTLPAALSFSQVSAEVLQPKCVACHSSFSKYSTVYSQRSRIQSEISSGSMPKGSSLTAAQKATILKWLAQGAPQ